MKTADELKALAPPMTPEHAQNILDARAGLDLEAMKAAALAATPGPWHETPLFQDKIDIIHGNKHTPGAASLTIARVTVRQSWFEQQSANARLIATMHPQAVLALIERLERAERVPLPVGAARVLQIRRAHASAKPTERNPAWMNSHRDMAVLFQRIDELEAELRRIHVEQAESVGFHLGAQVPSPDCWKCHDAAVAQGRAPAPRMILCPTCGNKRCPKASDHDLACTGSNEPGQPGSVHR